MDFSTYCVYNYTINADGTLRDYDLSPAETESSAVYQTNVLADLAVDFVRAHSHDDEPFYLEVMPLAPHSETCDGAYGGPHPHADSFESRIRPAPEEATAMVPAFAPSAAFNEDLADKPDWLSGVQALSDADSDNIAQQYQQRLRAVLAVDRLLGRIVAALGPRIDETTLIFTSDNGWLYGEHRVPGKIYPYEESARVPLYIAMPGTNVPSTRRNLVLNNDLAPTILDIAEPGYTDALFDGRSLVAILRGSQPPAWEDRQRALIAFGRSQSDPENDFHPTYSALRSRDSLYVESYDGLYYYPTQELIGLELYDLDNDPYEMNSLLHYPENERDEVLGSWLDLLSTCAGESCRQYENAVDSP